MKHSDQLRPSLAMVLLVVFAAAFCFALYLLGGCYHCKTPDCSELPCPGGDPGPCLELPRDASAHDAL